MGAAEPLRAVPKTKTKPKTQPALTRLSPVELAERRKHALVHNYWLSLRGDRPYPSIWDLDPFEIADAGANSVMLDLSKDRENPEIFVGEALRYDSGSKNDTVKQADAQSLLSCVLKQYRSVLAKSAPIAFEDQCAAEGGRTLSCIGTLFPFSSTGNTIDYVFGLLSWRDEGAATGDAVADDATSEVAPPIDAMPDNVTSDDAEAVTDEAVLDEAAPDDVAPEEVVSAVAVPEAAVPDDAVALEAMADDLVLAEAAADDAAPEEAVSEDMVCETAVPDAAVPEGALSDEAAAGEAAPEDLVQAAADDVSPEEPVSEDAGSEDDVSDAAVPEDAYGALSAAAVARQPVIDDAVLDEATSDLGREDTVLEDAVSEAVVPEEDVSDIAIAEDAPSNEAVTEDEPGESLSGGAMPGDAVPDDPVSDAAPFDDAPAAGAWPVDARSDDAASDDIRSRFTAVGKAVFAVVKHLTVSDRAVSFGPAPGNALSGHDTPASDAESGTAVPDAAMPDAVVPDAAMPEADMPDATVPAADMPDMLELAVPDDAMPEAGRSGDAGSDGADPGEPVADAVPDEVAPDDAGSDNAVSEEEAVVDDATAGGAASDVAVPVHAIIVPMVPYDRLYDDDDDEEEEEEAGDVVSDDAVVDDPTAGEGTSDLPMPEDAVIVPMMPYDSGLDDAEADEAVFEEAASVDAPVSAPDPEVAVIEEDVAATEQHQDADTPSDSGRCADEEAKPAVPAAARAEDDLRKQLAIAQAIASAAPDANYHSRAALYVALGHAYDFALAAEAQPEAYRTILDDAGLEFQVQAPMAPLVELVFSSAYDRKRLNDFAAALSWARRANLPPGSLAGHLEFLEAGLAIVAPA